MTNAAPPTPLRFVPVPEEIAERARRTMKDAFGHSLHVQREHGPCRICLRIASEEEPEDFILLSYQPLADRNPYAEIGPIFVHARPCTPYDADAYPEAFLSRTVVVRAYDKEGAIFDATIAGPGEAEGAAATFLMNPTVEEVHVRAQTYTCYDFKIIRR
ncbi:MAG TPA: DUF1203 domain-containing protein [Candidatus Baltobacteraceae bacterium]|jgi:hypothetical protein|nr:DUF1203 domain-containing protein [Candidatus Baltobacteraceae bacterium]